MIISTVGCFTSPQSDFFRMAADYHCRTGYVLTILLRSMMHTDDASMHTKFSREIDLSIYPLIRTMIRTRVHGYP
eukprot:SAG31_NODE_1922_length_6916_cov_3.724219_4_plen_75_part_00